MPPPQIQTDSPSRVSFGIGAATGAQPLPGNTLTFPLLPITLDKGLAALDNPMLAGMAKRPEFRAAAVLHELPSEATIQNRSPKPRRKDRIQDKELQQMSDDGGCPCILEKIFL